MRIPNVYRRSAYLLVGTEYRQKHLLSAVHFFPTLFKSAVCHIMQRRYEVATEIIVVLLCTCLWVLFWRTLRVIPDLIMGIELMRSFFTIIIIIAVVIITIIAIMIISHIIMVTIVVAIIITNNDDNNILIEKRQF